MGEAKPDQMPGGETPPLKAISLWQPWASAMPLGLKAIETRHWSTRYRGLLVIHAAKRWTRDEREFAEMQGLTLPLPLGALVAIGRLVDIQPTEKLIGTISSVESEWGNYGPGRFGWIFEDIHPLPEPIPYRGAQGFFDVPSSILGASGGVVKYEPNDPLPLFAGRL